MSSSTTFRPTMSQSASRCPATASLMSSFCFRRTVSAARSATFSGAGRLSPAPPPLIPDDGDAASRGTSSLMAATTTFLLPCRSPGSSGANRSSPHPRRGAGGVTVAAAAARVRPVNSMHEDEEDSDAFLAALRISRRFGLCALTV
ncbi:Os03g0179750 [Oryza sativa Japonica Group]|uniref:Os03g0179750 protein n=1 Tax=Oryza sativa subsp. japonica TaxID=39947 RepID=A0A0N7KGP7_ORYSJ|nr:Os03g0179750 [Oryza sativa Japonica Group]